MLAYAGRLSGAAPECSAQGAVRQLRHLSEKHECVGKGDATIAHACQPRLALPLCWRGYLMAGPRPRNTETLTLTLRFWLESGTMTQGQVCLDALCVADGWPLSPLF